MRYIYIIIMIFSTLKAYGSDTIRLKSINNDIVSSQVFYTIETNSANTQYSDSSGNQFNSKSDIIIKFENQNDVDIEYIESKYGLKYKREMTIGDIIFENDSDTDTLEIINNMVEDESLNIKRIMPNLIFNMNKL